MSYIKGLTQEHFKALILEHILDPEGVQTLSTVEDKVQFAKSILLEEVGWMIGQGNSRQQMCEHWLQGLATACTLPFTYFDIEVWAKACVNRPLSSAETKNLQRDYWSRAAQGLNVLINQFGG
jgi:hypothetical protein